MKAGMSHDTPKKENALTLGGKIMEVHTADDTGDRKVKKKKKKTGKEENRLAAIIAMNELTCTFGKVINEYEV